MNAFFTYYATIALFATIGALWIFGGMTVWAVIYATPLIFLATLVLRPEVVCYVAIGVLAFEAICAVSGLLVLSLVFGMQWIWERAAPHAAIERLSRAVSAWVHWEN